MHDFRFVASLRVFSQEIDPFYISEQLGLTPKWTHRIGEARTNPKGVLLGGINEFSYCSFNIVRDENEELHAMLDRTVSMLLKHETLFRNIRIDGGRAEFFIGWFSEGNTGDTLSHTLLAKLGQLQIDLALDIYGSD